MALDDLNHFLFYSLKKNVFVKKKAKFSVYLKI